MLRKLIIVIAAVFAAALVAGCHYHGGPVGAPAAHAHHAVAGDDMHLHG